jgi:hypothetical protein
MLLAGAAFGQTRQQSDSEKQIASTKKQAALLKEQAALLEEKIALMRDPASVKTEFYEADSEEYKVRVSRVFLKVPARAASQGVKARKAATVATGFRIEVIYRVATTQRREAQTEAALLGADLADAIKIDGEAFESHGDINGKPTESTMRYYAGTKLVASCDVMAGDANRANKILDRMLNFDTWARARANKE